MNSNHRKRLFMPVFLLGALLLSACGSNTPANGGNTATPGSTALTNVSIAFGYIPDIQFSPFYVAQSKGYYKAAGLNVTFHHGFVNDLIGSMALGRETFVFASGDEDLVARSKNLPVVDVAAIYQRYPVSIIVPANSSIRTLADLKGRTIGEPGPFGATHVGLLGLLYQARLSLSDVRIQSIGFTQVTALLTHRVDAVVGYSNNEPLQLQKQGMAVRTFNVSDYQPLISNGILTTESTLQNQPQTVKAFVQATLKGLQDVLANPADAVQISKSYIPGMNVDTATSVLQATLPFWRSNNGQPPGYNDGATWQSMAQFLVAVKILSSMPDVSKAYTNVDVS